MLCSLGDKRSVIEHYFKRGFCCGTIVHFLAEYHEISLNVKTLKRRRLRQFGFDEETIFIRTRYSGNNQGWNWGPFIHTSWISWMMWNKLRATYHVTVPRDVVMEMCQSTRIQMHMLFVRLESCNVTSHQHGKRNAACRWLRQVEAVWLTWFMAISMDSLGELYSLKYVKAATTQYPSKFFLPYSRRQ